MFKVDITLLSCWILQKIIWTLVHLITMNMN